MPRFKCPLVSRVRKIRTHGLNRGSYPRSRARAVRQVGSTNDRGGRKD